jgi:hypothetical protein
MGTVHEGNYGGGSRICEEGVGGGGSILLKFAPQICENPERSKELYSEMSKKKFITFFKNDIFEYFPKNL